MKVPTKSKKTKNKECYQKKNFVKLGVSVIRARGRGEARPAMFLNVCLS